jgi:broad specificity phosphatase PhoE/predicted kinase
VPHRKSTPDKHAFVMVGLPARGKSYIARKLARYLRWLGHDTRVFNVGSYRRELVGAQQSNEFFSPANAEGAAARLKVAETALDDMIGWFDRGLSIGIYDATNSTRERRAMLRKRLEAKGIEVIFVETVCHDPAVVDRNVRETKLHSPDYAGVPPERAVDDFLQRIAHYERAYETVTDDEGAHVKLIDEGDKVVAYRIDGAIPARAVFFLMNLQTRTRTVWLTRHGESVFNVEDRVGGDSELSPRGVAYARSLAAFMESRREDTESEITVWTSQLKRTIQTGSYLPESPLSWRALDEIDAGVCDGMTYTEIRRTYPYDFAARAEDKLGYRYPRGESYADLIQRLEPIIIETERCETPILIIGHQAVLRALYAYLTDSPPAECPFLPMPLHTVIELVPNAYGCTERRYELTC